MTDAGTSGALSGESKRVAPRSPRAALEPEYMSEPNRPSRRARHPLVIAGNAIFTIILVTLTVTVVSGVTVPSPDDGQIDGQTVADL